VALLLVMRSQRSGCRKLGVWMAGALTAAVMGPACGQGVFEIPHPAIAWWAVDSVVADGSPAPAPERLAGALARFLMAEELVGGETPALGAAVLAGSIECGLANRIVLIDVAGEPGDLAGTWRPQRLAVVVEVADESGAFEAAIRAAAGGDGDVIEGPLQLEGAGAAGLTGRWFQINGPPETRHVEVAIGGGWTRIGLGANVLQEWLAPGDGPGATASLQRAVRGQEGGRQVLEAMVDLDRLREAVPAQFSQTQVGRGLDALGLANARAFSFGIAEIGEAEGVAAFALSWAARSDPIERAVGVPLAASRFESPAAPWAWSIDVNAGLRPVIERSLRVVRTRRTKFGMMEFDRALERWSKSDKGRSTLNVVTMGAVEARLGIGTDGMMRARVMLPGAAAADVAAAIGSLPGAQEAGASAWEVVLLGAADDPAGVLRRIAITMTAENTGVVVEATVVGP
jgi:hypothetical protein